MISAQPSFIGDLILQWITYCQWEWIFLLFYCPCCGLLHCNKLSWGGGGLVIFGPVKSGVGNLSFWKPYLRPCHCFACISCSDEDGGIWPHWPHLALWDNKDLLLIWPDIFFLDCLCLENIKSCICFIIFALYLRLIQCLFSFCVLRFCLDHLLSDSCRTVYLRIGCPMSPSLPPFFVDVPWSTCGSAEWSFACLYF